MNRLDCKWNLRILIDKLTQEITPRLAISWYSPEMKEKISESINKHVKFEWHVSNVSIFLNLLQQIIKKHLSSQDKL